jgi:L-threonylcarbamoyladenylate synthase
VPICAPSANKFAHISPTSSVHVFNDLFDKEIAILDGASAWHGMESTVVKLIRNSEERAILVLRHGSVPTSRIREVISQDKRFSGVKIYEKDIEACESVTKNAEAPGQLLQHYCPKIQTVLVGLAEIDFLGQKKEFDIDFAKTVVVDFGEAYKSIFGTPCSVVLKYLDLSPLGNVEEAMRNFYAYLRDAELVTGAETILIIGKSDMSAGVKAGREFFPALYDKMFRSASGLAAGMVRAESGEVKLYM